MINTNFDIYTVLNAITISNVIGIIGVSLIIIAYFFVQTGRWHHMLLRLPITNLIGALCILVSLIETPNIPSIIIECVWIIISLYGIRNILRTKKAGD